MVLSTYIGRVKLVHLSIVFYLRRPSLQSFSVKLFLKFNSIAVALLIASKFELLRGVQCTQKITKYFSY